MDAHAVRRLLEDAYPFYKNLGAKAVSNIRRSAYLALDDPNFDPDMDPFLLQKYMPQGMVAADETSGHDPKAMQHNFGTILAEVMRNSEHTWKALGFLKTLKRKISGFDYRVLYDDLHQPTGIMWMFPEQRQFLIRFASILFLDMRKAMANTLNYPYCAITMMDQNRSPIVGGEALVCTESLANYQWLLESAASIEPSFKLHSIKLIFGDQFLQQSLLDNLGIRETCLLRGDTYHLYAAPDSVFLRNFTTNFYGAIKPFLSGMLFSKDKDSWDRNYNMAKEKLVELGAVSKINYLDTIYHNPTYYSGYVLAAVEGNCQLHGSSHAEQNHSSVASQFLDSTVMSLERNIEELCIRQGRLLTIRREQQSVWYITPHVPLSSNPMESQIEVAAHRVLDKKPFNELLLPRLKAMKFIKMEVVCEAQNGKKCYKFIPIQHSLVSSDALGLVHQVDEGMRCSCFWRLAYDAQCEHEFIIDEKFYPEKWNFRWYNDHYWNQMYNTRIPVGTTRIPGVGMNAEGESEAQDLDLDIDGDGHNSSVLFCAGGDIDNPQATRATSSLTSRSVMMTCQTLCNLIQHDKRRITDACIILETMIQRCKQNLDLVATFGSVGDILRPSPSTYVPGIPQAMTTAVPTVRNLKRMKSTLEQQVSRKKSASRAGRALEPLQNIGLHNQNLVIERTEGREESTGPMPRQKPTRTCGLCRRKGHKVFHCPYLEKFAGTLLPIRRASSKHIREQLASDLSEPHKFATHQRPAGSNEIVHNEFPPRRGDHACIIIHRRLYINDERTDLEFYNNICFECTLLQGTLQGVEETYTHKLFSFNAVKTAVTSNQNSLVKSELSFSDENMPPLSQSTIDMSQCTIDM